MNFHLSYKVLATTQPNSLFNIIFVQPIRSAINVFLIVHHPVSVSEMQLLLDCQPHPDSSVLIQ